MYCKKCKIKFEGGNYCPQCGQKASNEKIGTYLVALLALAILFLGFGNIIDMNTMMLGLIGVAVGFTLSSISKELKNK